MFDYVSFACYFVCCLKFVQSWNQSLEWFKEGGSFVFHLKSTAFLGNEFTDYTSLCFKDGLRLLEFSDGMVKSEFEETVNANFSKEPIYGFLSLVRKNFQSWSWISDNPDQSNFNQSAIGPEDPKTFCEPSNAFVECNSSKCQFLANCDVKAKMGFICMYNESQCQNNSRILIGSRCYETFGESFSWGDARNHCLKENGDLAQFVSDEQTLQALGSRDGLSNLWVGLVKSRWYWKGISETEVTFSHWDQGQPIPDFNMNYACAAFTRNGTSFWWSAVPCKGIYQVVCFAEKVEVITNTDKDSKFIGNGISDSGVNILAISLGVGLEIIVLLVMILTGLFYYYFKERKIRLRLQSPSVIPQVENTSPKFTCPSSSINKYGKSSAPPSTPEGDESSGPVIQKCPSTFPWTDHDNDDIPSPSNKPNLKKFSDSGIYCKPPSHDEAIDLSDSKVIEAVFG